MLSAPAIEQMLFDARTYYLSVLAGVRVSSRLTLYTVAKPHSASLAISSVCLVGCFVISVVTFFYNATFLPLPDGFQSGSAAFLFSSPCLIRSTRLPCCYPPTEIFQILQSGLEVQRPALCTNHAVVRCPNGVSRSPHRS